MKIAMNKKISINKHISRNILSLLISIFIVILVSFNLAMNVYIKYSSSIQLKNAKDIIRDYEEKMIPIDRPQIKNEDVFSEFIRFIQHKVGLAMTHSDAEVIVVNKNLEIIFPKNEQTEIDEEYKKIVSELDKQEIDLNYKEKVKIETDDRKYYISFMPVEKFKDIKKHYLVLVMDISNTLYLTTVINFVLITIMIFASILSFLIINILSSKISKPIVELSKFAKRIGKGDFTNFNKEFVDIELNELCSVMNKSATSLYEYDKNQKNFFQNVSHELRTPLMSIKGYAEAIKYSVMDKESAVDIILDESDRLTNLVEELLYISKIDNITKEEKLIECDLREILISCVNSQKIEADKKNIEFICNFDEDEVLFKCDEKRVYRAFLNLINNAIRYAKSKIILECRKENKKIYISITDDGHGIKEEDIEFIFDRFYKGYKGKNGIGLSIVKSVIENNNGEVYATNSEIGAKFIIIFDI